ncbi:MAG TPA: alternative ribosome rescue aminoacyl-tRNA hydrolase ArfB [Steroidobacteraceae bacterium]|nr:alternative ribosome rescue aminoacyl-tRNA hydrolase ArfB [Steroidobacteraceae bacterium]
MALVISAHIAIPDEELEWKFVRSSGPGGQNVNKVSSAVQLRFLLGRNTSLPAAVKSRLMALAGQRLTEDGSILLSARSERSQEQNRRLALERLAALIRAALVEPKVRKKTRPTRASRERRIESKKRRSATKRERSEHRWD